MRRASTPARRLITEAEIEAGKSSRGGFAEARLRAWGVSLPLKPGWRRKLLRVGVPAACPVPEGFCADGEAAGTGVGRAAAAVAGPGAITIFTDGSVDDTAGGWAFAAYRGACEIYCECGGEACGDINRMELQAVVRALEWLAGNAVAVVWMDSRYVAQGASERRAGLRKETWTRAGGPVRQPANLDLWTRLTALVAARSVELRWTRGHAGTPGNERADALAALGRRFAAASRRMRRKPL